MLRHVNRAGSIGYKGHHAYLESDEIQWSVFKFIILSYCSRLTSSIAMSMFFKHMMSFDIIVEVQRCFDPQMPLCYWVRCSQFHPLICRERSSSGAIDSPVNYYSSAWIFIPPNRTILNETQMYHKASRHRATLCSSLQRLHSPPCESQRSAVWI